MLSAIHLVGLASLVPATSAPEAPAPVTTPSPVTLEGSPLALSYDGGLVLDWDGGQLVLEGLLEFGADADLGADDGAREPHSEFYLKRFRPELFGLFDGGWCFRFEPKFTQDEVELEEAWVGHRSDAGTLRLGRMKAPFGLEEVRSRRHIHFPRFSLLNQFSPAEDHGLFWNGQEGRLEYAMALYNGTGGSDEDEGKDVALRAMWHAAEGSDHPWQVGLATTFGDQERSIAGDGIKNAGGQRVVDFAAGTELDGQRTRVGLEWAQFFGPLMVQAEALSVEQDLRTGATTDTVGYTGAYVDLAYALTGEDLTFKGVRNPEGSWVAALRLSTLELDDELASYVDAGTYTDSITGISLGLNYVPGPHAILRTALTRSMYGDDEPTIGGATVDHEDLLTVELQLHF